MKQAIIGGVLVVVIILLLTWSISSTVGRMADETTKQFSTYIGSKIVLDKDTLLITDYSLLRNTLILKNGTEVNLELVNQLTIIKPKKK